MIKTDKMKYTITIHNNETGEDVIGHADIYIINGGKLTDDIDIIPISFISICGHHTQLARMNLSLAAAIYENTFKNKIVLQTNKKEETK